ncbi:flagellar hook-associated 2-like protein [Sphingopyxis sp. H038]|uniref:flagellar filament capping protein FliD n=1 Tax=unclassified Sphingopyxis TaxID=2614943 RepID=UPI000730B8CE|nr:MULTISPECIES: flagellar filament capping protein FliD [unclassified Sphingopyxis]KTE00149.1 flagellar hook-associated 2-like protein [Sphingopyxis sp. H012]KTE07733.1 flagellar hook-associated 2-like protein [Sphingopyxis sp. H053]KTE11552.1 flagellar hook-associated 2-like protein [Sphingopyxis sp. H093]KTE27525.1 flagellar hook-associated 2-like protein [Sphingopyxis sp. H080]KTE33875.1 flagellar hook-associated 2-like protein [Sphingopyxis sp. H038]
MVSSIANSLGFGSGLDVKQLVTDLSNASRDPKIKRMNSLNQANQTRISALAQARSDLDGFANSLGQMVSDGTLRSTPTVSDESVLSATSRAGLSADSFAATVVVTQLARAQTNYSAVVADRTAAIGAGTMTLTVGGVAKTIAIGATNNSLEGLTNAINASGAGVTASIIADEGGHRLIVKGPTGEVGAFTLTADAGADPGLTAFSTSGGMTVGQTATNAEFTIDGVAFSRANNIVDDVIPGMSLTLKKAAPGQGVDIGASRPLEMIKQTVGDFVSVYNQLKKSLVAASSMSGATTSLREIERELSGLVNKVLSSHGSINKLSDIGISSTKDGLLSVDNAKLDKMLASDAGAVEALFNPRRDATHTEISDPGIAFALDAIRDKAVGVNGAIDRVSKTLDAKKENLIDQLEKIEERESAYKARLEKQYGTLEAKLAAFKATQTYLEQQIKLWTNQGND